MKYKFSLSILFISILVSCRPAGKLNIIEGQDIYKVKKIDKLNKWRVLYLEKGDSLYKVVTQNNVKHQKGCETIKKGYSYKLSLVNMRENAPTIDGKKIDPINYLHVPCRLFEGGTTICIEPEKKIFALYIAKELDGLCYRKPE